MDDAAALEDLRRALFELTAFADHVARTRQTRSGHRLTRTERLTIESDASTVAEAFKLAVRAAVAIT